MFDSILNAFRETPANDIMETRRKEVRHEGMQVDVTIGRRSYAVHDWSRAGISFETPDYAANAGGVYYEDQKPPQMKAGDMVRLTLRFHLLQGTVEIPVSAQISRVDGRGTVARLFPLSRTENRKFDGVIDSFHAQRFLESQLAN